MMGPVVVERLRIADAEGKREVRRPPRRSTGRFLCGPVPMPWLETAMALPGRALHVGVVLWFQAGLERSLEVSLSLSKFEERGVSRYAAARGLDGLERAGLVSTDHRRGRKVRVRILEAPTAPDALDEPEADDLDSSMGREVRR